MYILGIHIGHDATASLINGKGEVVAAIAEERLTRVKYITGFPYRAIDEVLKIGGVSKKEISIISLGAEKILYPGDQDVLDYFMTSNLDIKKGRDLFNDVNVGGGFAKIFDLILSNIGLKKNEPKEYKDISKEYTKEVVRKKLDEIGFEHSRLDVVEHHRSHAASAYYCGGKAEALVITIDGAGDGLCATASIVENGQLKRVSSATSDCSPGRFYSEITRFLGFKRNRHEGKITGLAAYGNPEKYYSSLKNFLKFNLKTEKFEYEVKHRSKVLRKFDTVLRILQNENFGNNHIDAFHTFLKRNFKVERDMEDLAAATQKISEEVAVEYVSHFLKKYPNKNVLLAGGIFANVRINQEISEIDEVDFVYIHQNMGDGGCSLGAAYISLYEIENQKYDLWSPTDVYFGNSYENDEVLAFLKNSSLKFVKQDEIEKEIAKLIHQGKVVGRFYGGMEYGPRALGNRSLLASPVDKSINDWLNKKLNRTEFMPFAPSVIVEEAKNLFEGYEDGSGVKASYFMTLTYNVKPEWHDKMQATTHVDGTARPQVVRYEDNPSYHKVISEYYKLSGIPGIINTSFNMHEEPIVATPEDAIRAFEQGAMDYLAIGDFLCEK